MRDPQRIKKICDEIAEVWGRMPDWRICQLFNNMQRACESDLFYMEDDKFIQLLNAFIPAGSKEHADTEDTL